jgi:hypothetical protein
MKEANPTPQATMGAKVPKRIRISPLEDTRGAIRGECHVYEDKGDDGTGNPVYVLEEPQAADAKMPPRVELFQDEEDWPEVDSIFVGGKIPQGNTEYLSLQEHTALLSQARAEAAEYISKMALTHLGTGSSDAYGQGLYNGMVLARSFITNEDASPVSLPVYLEMQKAAGSPNGAGEEKE